MLRGFTCCFFTVKSLFLRDSLLVAKNGGRPLPGGNISRQRTASNGRRSYRNGDPLEQGVVTIRKKVWGGIVGQPKSKRPRVFVLSPRLTRRMREICFGKEREALVFTNSKGGMLDPDKLVKRHLKRCSKWPESRMAQCMLSAMGLQP